MADTSFGLDAGWALYAMTGIGILCMWFIINKFIVEKNNPYAFTQFFDRSLVKIKMYEVTPASYNDQVTKPIIQFRGIGLYGNDGLYFKNIYPVNKDFLIRAEPGFYHFYYKSGGQKAIVPMMLSVFYADYIGSDSFEEADPVYEKGHEPTAAEVAKDVIKTDSGQLERDEKRERYKHLSFMIPSKEQLEIMTDNYIDNFMTRQQSIALQIANSLDILTKAIVPIGLFLIMALAILAVATTFSSDIVKHAIDKAVAVCPAPGGNVPPTLNTSSASSGAGTSSSTTPGGVFSGVIPVSK